MGPWRFTAWASGAALAAVLLAAPGSAAPGDDAAAQRGLQLYAGTAPLQGTITGHSAPLPPAAARCINCHAAGSGEPTRAASAPSSFGPLLTRERLTQRIARRGGPPSQYDETAFCRLLRQGIDPAWVLIPRDMPRYEIGDADCRALWLYLTRLP